MRELCWMVDGRRRDEWTHTANVLAMLYNAFRGRGARALQPSDFHPLERQRRAAPLTLQQLASLGVLKQPEKA